MRTHVSLLAVGLLAALMQLAAADVVYVTSFDTDSVLKFDAETGAPLGAFVPSGSGGLNGPTGLTFGPDGNLYVSSFVLNFSVLKYDGETGQFLGVFVTPGSGGLLGPMDLGFGPDGDLYVVSSYAGGVFRYDGTTGAFIDQFTTNPSGAEAVRWRGKSLFISGHNDDEVLRFRARNGAFQGEVNQGGFLDWATGFDFGADGNIYIASFFDDAVVKFNGRTGKSMGTFASGCDGPEMIEFGPNGDLYVAAFFGDSIDRFDGKTGALKQRISGNGLAGTMDIAFRDH
jgi:DNA-binding beta-propeller fold protein YncE